MDPKHRAVAAYGDVSTSTKTPRQIEYQAFARITKALTRSETAEEETPCARSQSFNRLAEALHENLRLWSIVQGDVASDRNALPEQLRANLFYLGECTREHTRKILRGAADHSALVEISTEVMRGLRHNGEAEPCPA